MQLLRQQLNAGYTRSSNPRRLWITINPISGHITTVIEEGKGGKPADFQGIDIYGLEITYKQYQELKKLAYAFGMYKRSGQSYDAE